MSEFDSQRLVAQSFGIELSTVDSEVRLEGSPERTAERFYGVSVDGGHYIFERFAQGTLTRKAQIFAWQSALASAGLPRLVLPLSDAVDVAGETWAVYPFVANEPLARPEYVQDAWRGEAMAQFLLDLKAASGSVDIADDPFDLAKYVENICRHQLRVWPELGAVLWPMFERWQSLRPSRLAMRFCHGDFHPLNMLWGERDLRAVIDWEFCGRKPALYDVALLLGCLGYEYPGHLQSPLTRALLAKLKGEAFVEDWAPLEWLVMGLRFVWVGEWLRKGDMDSLELELSWLSLLCEYPLFEVDSNAFL